MELDDGTWTEAVELSELLKVAVEFTATVGTVEFEELIVVCGVGEIDGVPILAFVFEVVGLNLIVLFE